MTPYEVLTELGYIPGDFGCAMLLVDTPDIDISEEDFYYHEDLHAGGGRQNVKHVTLRYGITDPNVALRHVQSLLEGVVVGRKPDELRVLGLGMFPTPDYEVIKWSVDDDVENGWLYRANTQMQVLPGINTFPGYVPHITLGYVKPGWFAKNVGLIEAPKFVYTGDVVYSAPGTDDSEGGE